MSKSIPISQKHGVNPTIPICFFCGKEKNEIVLLGKLPHDEKAPMHMCLDYEPCDDCKAKMAQGVTLIVVTETQPADHRKAMMTDKKQKVYPTGTWCVITAEAFIRMTDREWKPGDVCYIDMEVYQMLSNQTAPENTK